MKMINFYGTCSARSRTTLVSKLIKYPFAIKKILVTFPLGCNNLLQLSVHVSLDDSAPSSEAPGDQSIFAENSLTSYIVGNGIQKLLEHELKVNSRGVYLKVHANNVDYYDHDIDMQIMVVPL